MRWVDGYIAADWGTTNRRAYLIDSSGQCVDEFEDGKGVLSVEAAGFPAAVAEIRERLGDKPLLLAGMVGSNRGWKEAPYVPCPAGIDDLARSLVWVAREAALYWLDIKGLKIFRLNDDGQIDAWPTPLRVGSLAPRKSGGFIGGTEDGIAIIDPISDRYELVAKPEEDLPDNRFNDGKVDRRGRFWAGTMDDTEKDSTGMLYCVEQDLGVAAIDGGYKVTNGPAFSPSGDIMYHNDSARQVTYAFDMDSSGKPGE